MNTRERYPQEKSAFQQFLSYCPQLSLPAKTSLTIATLFIAAPHIERGSSTLIKGIQFFQKNFIVLSSFGYGNPTVAISLTACTFLFWHYIGGINTPPQKRRINSSMYSNERTSIPPISPLQQTPFSFNPSLYQTPFYPQQYPYPLMHNPYISQNAYPFSAYPSSEQKIFEIED